MVRLDTDQEQNQKEFSSFAKLTVFHTWPLRGGTRVSHNADRQRETVDKCFNCGFCGKKRVRQGKQV
jgi:hypothetical protein